MIVVVPEKETKSLESMLNKNKDLGLEENQPLVKLIYTQTTFMEVKKALYSSKQGTELLKEHSNSKNLVLLGSEQKFFTTSIKEFIMTKKFFSLL